MSPLWRDRIRIGLFPDKVVLVRLVRRWRPQIADQRIVPCDPDEAGEAPWQAPLTGLKEALPAFAPRRADAEAILSSAFTHHLLVPWSDQLSGEEEEIAYVRHCFARIYGDGAKRWALRMSPDRAGAHRVASAVDQRLLDTLASTLQEARLPLRSVQPYLMAAFNEWRPRFKDLTAWLAVVDGGKISLALLHRDRWHSLRTLKVGDSWADELLLILDRERLLVDVPEAPKEVFLVAPEAAEVLIPADSGWTIRRLLSPQQPGLAPPSPAAFATAKGS